MGMCSDLRLELMVLNGFSLIIAFEPSCASSDNIDGEIMNSSFILPSHFSTVKNYGVTMKKGAAQFPVIPVELYRSPLMIFS